MEHSYLEKRYNVMEITSVAGFAHIKGGMNGSCKDVYFLRAIGANASFAGDIAKMDRELTGRMAQGGGIYHRTGPFPRSIPPDEVQVYAACYEAWARTGRRRLFTRALPEASGMGELLGTACLKTLEAYHKSNENISQSIEKNFIIKLLYWTDTLALSCLEHWDPRASMKFIAQGIVKEQEYLFCYYLTLLGIDVLLLQNEKDIDGKLDGLHLSGTFILGEKKAVYLEAYDRTKYEKESRPQPVPAVAAHPQAVDLRRPHPPGNRKSVPARTAATGAGSTPALSGAVRALGRELTFEELALKAASVVMIALHGSDGAVVGSGSGIMIGRNGYILTNDHVARHGRFYSVRIENDETVYQTDEIIKYNQFLDLAVIRIKRTLEPLPVYQGGSPLVRGQKVVAIGSPLGLFNSVSDGIISGFRNVRDVDMIQFTAPISNGSSGGAVLNMYGEVIGVTTSGYDAGQNINLAVGYEFINSFVRGFR